MTVHQVAEYLQLNEKKIYALVSERRLPATKVTGKWMFPTELIDQWLLESSHKGILQDRLTLAGPDDALLLGCMSSLGRRNQHHALVAYSCHSVRPALDLLAAERIEIAVVNWGPAAENRIRHPALMELHRGQNDWILISGLKRELGVVFKPSTHPPPRELNDTLTGSWCGREKGDGVWRFLQDAVLSAGLDPTQMQFTLNADSERETAAAIAGGQADYACASRAAAKQFGLGFMSIGWEQLDFAMRRDVWFRRLLQMTLDTISTNPGMQLAQELGGYDFEHFGTLIWGDQ